MSRLWCDGGRVSEPSKVALSSGSWIIGRSDTALPDRAATPSEFPMVRQPRPELAQLCSPPVGGTGTAVSTVRRQAAKDPEGRCRAHRPTYGSTAPEAARWPPANAAGAVDRSAGVTETSPLGMAERHLQRSNTGSRRRTGRATPRPAPGQGLASLHQPPPDWWLKTALSRTTCSPVNGGARSASSRARCSIAARTWSCDSALDGRAGGTGSRSSAPTVRVICATPQRRASRMYPRPQPAARAGLHSACAQSLQVAEESARH